MSMETELSSVETHFRCGTIPGSSDRQPPTSMGSVGWCLVCPSHVGKSQDMGQQTFTLSDVGWHCDDVILPGVLCGQQFLIQLPVYGYARVNSQRLA